MDIAIAPNAFRGSLSAAQAAFCIAEGLQRSRLPALPLLMPLADGGDGTLDVALRGLGGERIELTVRGPLGQPVRAALGLFSDGQTALIEMAQASGVELISKHERDPLRATSYGTGELIRAAVERGFKRILIGLGGSATNDGGAGAMQALGARLLDSDGNEIGPGGAALSCLARIETDALQRLLYDAELVALCDVDNPLTGSRGASAVFAPQKGANAEAVETLEAALSHFAEIIQRDLNTDISQTAGGGAAGGFGAGLVAFTGARIAPGAETLIRLLGYDQQLGGAALLITGEGKLDSQTASGKAVRAIAAEAARHEIPVLALVGTLDCSPADLAEMNIESAFSIIREPCTLEEASAHAAEWLTQAAQNLANTLALSIRK